MCRASTAGRRAGQEHVAAYHLDACTQIAESERPGPKTCWRCYLDSTSAEIRGITNLVRSSLMKRIELHDERGRGRGIGTGRSTIGSAASLVVRLERSPHIAGDLLKVGGGCNTSHPDVEIRIHHDSSAEVADRQRNRF